MVLIIILEFREVQMLMVWLQSWWCSYIFLGASPFTSVLYIFIPFTTLCPVLCTQRMLIKCLLNGSDPEEENIWNKMLRTQCCSSKFSGTMEESTPAHEKNTTWKALWDFEFKLTIVTEQEDIPIMLHLSAEPPLSTGVKCRSCLEV